MERVVHFSYVVWRALIVQDVLLSQFDYLRFQLVAAVLSTTTVKAHREVCFGVCFLDWQVSSCQCAVVGAAYSSSLHPACTLSKYRFCGFRKRQAAGNKFRLQNMSIETYEWHQRHMGHVVLRSVQWGFTSPIFTHRRPAVQHSCSLNISQRQF